MAEMTKEKQAQILENAKKQADKYVASFDLSGKKRNKQTVQRDLNKRTHEGQPVHAIVVDSPDDVAGALVKGLLYFYPDATKKQLGEKVKELSPQSCVWDYYLMAFYDCAYSQVPSNKENEFGRQSFFESFINGLGFYINLGVLGIGVMMPEAYRDDQKRIHRADGPAIIWGEQTQYWWHGVQIPADWIEKKSSIDVKLALTHENIEQRRCLAEIVGWDKILKTLKTKTLQSDEFGELLEIDLPDSPKARFVRVLCGTGRNFCLPVPQEMKTAHEAVAWTYNLDITRYQPEVRT